jgi:hypothetical protein
LERLGPNAARLVLMKIEEAIIEEDFKFKQDQHNAFADYMA